MIPLKVLMNPMNGVGHINACLGLAKALKKRGHKVIFAVDKQWEGKFVADGYEEETYIDGPPGQNEKFQRGKEEYTDFVKLILEASKEKETKDALQKMASVWTDFDQTLVHNDEQLKIIADRVQPDVVIQDNVATPSLFLGDAPWIFLCSGGPLCIQLPGDDKILPPVLSGLTVKEKDKWEEFNKVREQVYMENLKAYNELFEKSVYKRPRPDFFFTLSHHLNFYLCPEELDYTDIRTLDDRFFRLDASIREEKTTFEIPEKLKNLPGKLIYLSMGSIGSNDSELMKRLIDILTDSPHKFIVSKGLQGDKYELPDNMWGENFLPQTKVLPHVDLFITHGGNNSFTEALYFGKPMIILPLFGDQFDNAARIQEKGLGLRFHPYYVTKEELFAGIEQLLADEQLHEKLNKMSKRIQSTCDDTLDKAVIKIEEVVKNVSKK